MKNTKYISLLASAMLLCGPASAYAAATFTVQGNGLQGVAAWQQTIQYDTRTLTNPQVTPGSLTSGMQVVSYTNTPGQVVVTAVAPYPDFKSGSGPIATVTFDTVGNSSAAPTMSYKALDVNGKVIDTDQFASFDTGSGAAVVTISGSQAVISGGGAGTGWLGGVSMPSDGAATARGVASQPDDETVKDKPIMTAMKEEPKPATISESRSVILLSPLEQFRLFQGEKTPRALLALFKGAIAGSSQEPAIAIADGVSPVRVFIERSASGKAPNFALKGAKLVSVRSAGEDKWGIEAIPDKGACQAAITVMEDGRLKEIPLTVAPPLPAGLKIGEGKELTEATFNVYLRIRGTEKAPMFDLNGDGKRDYVDDYIFTANYLANSGHEKSPDEKKAELPK